VKSLRQLRELVVYLGTNTSPWMVVGAFLALNVYWTVLLGVLDEPFRETTGGLPCSTCRTASPPGRSSRPGGC
jgi:hypothetical protein